MNAPHTAGPWSVGSHRSITSPSGTICETYSHMGESEADANERLIAAAPDLLNALEDILYWTTDKEKTKAEWNAMRAIYIATGRQP